jgi:hypothetical protein
MELTNEKLVKSYEYDIEGLSPEEYTHLRNYGLKEIKKDDEALINYAFNKILYDFTQDMANNVKRLDKLVEQAKKDKAKTAKTTKKTKTA